MSQLVGAEEASLRSEKPDESLDAQHSSGEEDHEPPKDEEEAVAAPDAQPAAVEPAKPAPRVDGGLEAWLVVLGAFCGWANSWGLIAAFGVFQTFYQMEFLQNESASTISWIGSLQACLVLLIGTISGPLTDAGYSRQVIFIGNVIISFGMMMTSLAREYYQFILAQGIVVGLGLGLIFAPCIAIVPQYFVKKRAIAGGIAAAGTGVGGVIYPVMFYRLQPRVGFGYAVRYMGFVVLAIGAIMFVTMKSRVPPRPMRALLTKKLFDCKPLLWVAGGNFFILAGLYIPIFFISIYSMVFHITDTPLAFYLLPILQTGSVFGRLVPVFLVNRIGPVQLFIPVCLVGAILCFSWITIKSQASLIVFSVLYGMVSGMVLSLLPVTIPALWGKVELVGTVIGMIFIVGSMGVLIGAPTAAYILEDTGSFAGLQAYSGALCIVAACFYTAARIQKLGFKRGIC